MEDPMLAILALLACSLTPEDCFRTYGDNCECKPQCLTAHKKKAAERGKQCDIDCDEYYDSGASWDCAVQDNECVVVWTTP
jgi:hypothetical protein